MTNEAEGSKQKKPRVKGRKRRVAKRIFGVSIRVFLSLVGLVVIVIGGAWLWFESTSSGEVIAARVEEALEAGLGRQVRVGDVSFKPGLSATLVVSDIRIDNIEGSSRPNMVQIERVETSLSLRALVDRQVRVKDVTVIGASIVLEILRDEDGRVRTNIPKWQAARTDTGETRELDVDIESITFRDATFELFDRAHGIEVIATGIDVESDPDLSDLTDPRAAAVATATDVVVRLGRIEFPTMTAVSRFRIENQALHVDMFRSDSEAVQSRARGTIYRRRLELFAEATGDLEKLQPSLGLSQQMRGSVEASARVGGPFRRVSVDGEFTSPSALFDVYGATAIAGTFHRIENGIAVDIEEGRFAGGTVTAHYERTFGGGGLNSLDVVHDDVAVEDLLNGWGVPDSGLLARADGEVSMAWVDGESPGDGLEGHATIEADFERHTNARYGTVVDGAVEYSTGDGRFEFERLELETSATRISLSGPLGLGGEPSALRTRIESSDIAEVDRLWLDLAHSFGLPDWELLQMDGDGTISAEIDGALRQPFVTFEVAANQFEYAATRFGRAEARLRYDGVEHAILFDDVRFDDDGATLTIRDRLGLAEPGGEPELAVSLDIHGWQVKSLLGVIGLELAVDGAATGRIAVLGHPSDGVAKFDGFMVEKEGSRITLNGQTGWSGEEKGLSFDLDVALRDVPVASIASILELGDLPLSGATTGTLHLEGPMTGMAGAGSLAIRRAALVDEPVDLVAADLLIESGVVRLNKIDVRMPAGFVRGEAKIDLGDDRFGFVISASEIDIERLAGYPSVKNVVTGKVVLSASGAGTLENPELVADLSVIDATLLEQVVESPGIEVYFALRNGEYMTFGRVGSALTLDGRGRFDSVSREVSGNVDLTVANIASVTKRFELRTGIGVSGSVALGLELGGSFASLEELRLDGMLSSMDIGVGEHRIKTTESAEFHISDGALSFDSFDFDVDEERFAVDGSLSLVGETLDLRFDGLLEAGLLGYVMSDLRASGDIGVSLALQGTFDEPVLKGTAEIIDATFRVVGFPQSFRNVKSSIDFDRGRMGIDSFSAQVGGGQVTAGGYVQIDGASLSRIRVNSQWRDVKLRLDEGLSAEGNFDLVLAGVPSERMIVQGEAALRRLVYTKDIEFGSAIVDLLVTRRPRIEAVEEEWERRVGLKIRVDAKDAIVVRNNLANVTGTADFEVSGNIAQPIMLGRMTIDEGGRLDIGGVEYRVASGSVNFQNPITIDPYVDVVAEGRYRGEYELTVAVSGTLDALDVAITSDPPIADLSLLSVLGMSGSGDDLSARDAVQSAGASIIDASVGALIGSKLSFADNVRLEGITGAEPRVTIEKTISEKVRTIVTYTMNDAGDNIEIIEWRLSPRFVILATRDSTKDTSFVISAIDVSFSRRYEGRW